MNFPVRKALLVLENGLFFYGNSFGAEGETFGELVFNTGMTGYQEILTDPSYKGQIVLMTYPEIGIYGVNEEDFESADIQVAGFVVCRAVKRPFNRRASMSLVEYLQKASVVAIEGVDTRALTRRIRAKGAMRAGISTVELDPEKLLERVKKSPRIEGRDLVKELKSSNVAGKKGCKSTSFLRIVVIDTGVKAGIIRHLKKRGVGVVRMPYPPKVREILDLEPDGILLSNGPGDPAALSEMVGVIRKLLERQIPLGGICLGHQLLALAIGGRTYKMRFGHHGINHPVKNLCTGHILITSHNHGFAVDPTAFGIPKVGNEEQNAEMLTEELKNLSSLQGESPLGFGGVEVTHLSLNDGTVEGIRLLDLPAISVQFHPEASPGPHDAESFFDEFISLVEVNHA